jgi:hypothetical protein
MLAHSSTFHSIHPDKAEVQPPSTRLLSRSQSSLSLSSSNCSAQTLDRTPPIKFVRKNRSDLARAASSSSLSDIIEKNSLNMCKIIEKNSSDLSNNIEEKAGNTKTSSVLLNIKSSLPLAPLPSENYDKLFEFLTTNDP